MRSQPGHSPMGQSQAGPAALEPSTLPFSDTKGLFLAISASERLRRPHATALHLFAVGLINKNWIFMVATHTQLCSC